MDQGLVEGALQVLGFPLAVVVLTQHIKRAVRAVSTGSYWHSTEECSLWPLVADTVGVVLAIAYWYGGLAGSLLDTVGVAEPNVLTMALLGLGGALAIQRGRDFFRGDGGQEGAAELPF